jgi:hypothetical protein
MAIGVGVANVASVAEPPGLDVVDMVDVVDVVDVVEVVDVVMVSSVGCRGGCSPVPLRSPQSTCSTVGRLAHLGVEPGVGRSEDADDRDDHVGGLRAPGARR